MDRISEAYPGGRHTIKGELITYKEGDLSSILDEMIANVIFVLEKYNCCVIGGPSGVGKTELLLGENEAFHYLGGTSLLGALQSQRYSVATGSAQARLWEALKPQKNTRFFSGRRSASNLRSEFELAGVIIIDESTGLDLCMHGHSESIDFFGKLIKGGKKVVFVGGGSHTSADQIRIIRTHVKKMFDIVIPKKADLVYNPLALTVMQTKELFKKETSRSQQDAENFIRLYRQLGYPFFYRILLQSVRFIGNKSITVETITQSLRNWSHQYKPSR